MITSPHPVTPDDVARHYDELDDVYRTIWGEHIHHGLWTKRRDSPEEAVLNLIEHLAAHLDLAPGREVCDVGCGYGATARYLARKWGCDLTGITISERQHHHAVLHAERGTRFFLGDWMQNRLRDDAFDAVIAIESLSHMTDKRGFFGEAARVLRPGGRLGITCWLASPALTRSKRTRLLQPICSEGRLTGIGAMTEYIDMMRQAGLDLVVVEDLTRRVRRTWNVVIVRFLRQLAVDSSYRRRIADPSFESRIFAATVLRIWLAYRLDAMRYGMIIGEKPEPFAAA